MLEASYNGYNTWIGAPQSGKLADTLRAAGFKWSGKRRAWYAAGDNRAAVAGLGNVEAPAGNDNARRHELEATAAALDSLDDMAVGDQIAAMRAYLAARKMSPDGIPVRKAGRLGYGAIIWARKDGGGYIVEDVGFYEAADLEECARIVEIVGRKADLMHHLSWQEIVQSGDGMGPADILR